MDAVAAGVSNKGSGAFKNLTRRHGLKVPVGAEYSVEECCLAVGELVGYDSMKAASRMNSAIVIFVDTLDKVNTVVERGIVLRNTHIGVFPLVNPAKKVILSNLPPFISNEALERELSRHGQIVSAMKFLSSGCKSARVKHLVGFRRQVYMILKNEYNDELKVVMKFKVDGFDYTIFVTTESMKCFGCGKEGHLARGCPEKRQGVEAQEPQAAQAERQAEVVERQDVVAEAVLQVVDVEEGRSDVVAEVVAAETGEQAGSEGGSEEAAAQRPNTDSQQEGGQPSASTSSSNIVISAPTQTSVEGEDEEEMNVDSLTTDGETRIRDEENLFKVPRTKGKTRSQAKGIRSKKKVVQDSGTNGGSDTDSDLESSDSSLADGQKANGYSLEQIRSFLEKMKGRRAVNVGEVFPNRSLFVESAKWLIRHRGADGLMDTEVYRLRKIVQRVNAEISNDQE